MSTLSSLEVLVVKAFISICLISSLASWSCWFYLRVFFTYGRIWAIRFMIVCDSFLVWSMRDLNFSSVSVRRLKSLVFSVLRRRIRSLWLWDV
jgi:hypothetical protein